MYFIKKEGNNSAHTSGAKLPATTALDCLQRAFEVSINYAFSKNPKKTKLLKLEFDTELLITGEKAKKSLKEKYIEAKEKNKITKEEPIIELSTKRTKKKDSNLIGVLALVLIVVLYICCLVFK